jgi:hypothetical protein
MSLLEKEILKYEKRGFKVEQKRTLKYGSRTFLKKEGGFFGGFEGVYIYYVDGDSTTDSLRECFKDYVKFYEAEEFGEGDKGFFICSGSGDEKLFKDLRKAMINDEEIRNSIKVVGLGKEILEKATKKEVLEEVIRKAPKELKLETPKVENVIEKIKKFSPHKTPKKEKELENMLVSYLSAFYPNIQTQMSYERTKIDVTIGNIGIEIKHQPSASELDRLYGQVDKYCRHLDKIIIVIGYEKSREYTESFEQRLRQRNWLNSKVFLVTIR